ncbi:MAG: YceK/YidQ family lipoprotein [Victivallales bacterium]|nr:YceK/YidQ family lipoprotein [Victivallales bacterium]
MRRWLNIVFILGIMAMATGCVRLSMEFDHGNRHYFTHHKPEHSTERLYEGTRQAAKNINTNLSPLTPYLILDLPFEIVADTLCLPLDAWMYSKYLMHPPLEKLVMKHKLKALASRLAQGDPPNSNSVYQAIHQHDSEAFALLAEYGATITDIAYRTINLQNKEIIEIALKHDKNISEKYAESDILLEWMRLLKMPKTTMTATDETDFLEIIDMLAHHGFGINVYGNEYTLRQTPLDIAHGNKMLSEKSRSHLVSVLKSNGAMTYRELALKKNLPHLRTDGLEIHPMFNPLLEILETQPKAETIRLSTHYQGIEAPVLVVDYPEERTIVKMHRRKADGTWNQDTEDFDIPACFRMIFTPPDVHVPSRFQADMPLFLLEEKRFSFKDYELLLEIPGGIANDLDLPWHKNKPSKVFEEIMQLPRNPNGKYASDDISGSFVSELGMNTFLRMTEYTRPLTYEDKEWLEKANRLTAEAGLAGRWRRMQFSSKPGVIFSGDSSWVYYVFTNHERFPERILPGDIPAPYPDEIICIFTPNDFKPTSNTVIKYDGQAGRTYWNHWNTMHANILFGDEIKKDTLDLLRLTILDIMKK